MYPTGRTVATLKPYAVAEAKGKWSNAKELPLPANLAKGLGAGPITVFSVSCASVRACTVVGQYPVSDVKAEAFIDTEMNGSWSAAQARMPRDAPVFGSSSLKSISCHDTGDCEAAGWYFDGAGVSPAVLSETAGKWSAVKVNIPSNGELQGADNSINTITCPTRSECVVGGSYDTTAGVEGFFDDVTGKIWSKPTEAKLPIAASAHQDDHGESGLLGIHAVSCSTPLHCAAGGAFISSVDKVPDSYSAITYTRSGRAWLPGLTPGLPPGSARPSLQYSNVVGASCQPSGCTIVGTYYDRYSYGSFSATPASLPSPPVIRKITERIGAMTLSLRPPSATGGLPIIRYQYSVDAGSLWKNSTSGASTTIVLTHLVAHHTYRLSVRAVTEEGFSAGSRVVVATARDEQQRRSPA